MQIGGEIKAPLSYDDSIQILLKLAWILTFTIQAYFRRIYMESSEHNAYISCQVLEQVDFWQLQNIFLLACSLWIYQPIP